MIQLVPSDIDEDDETNGRITEFPMKVAQIVLAPVIRRDFITVNSLDNTSRGEGGFGSTDKFDRR